MKRSSEDTDFARRAARVLAEADRPGAATNAIGDRAATIQAIEQALNARRRRVRPWLLAAAAAAAATAAVFALAWNTVRAPQTAVAPRTGPLHAERSMRLTIAAVDGAGALLETAVGTRLAQIGDSLTPGTWIRTGPDSHVLVAFENGTRVRVPAEARMQLAALGRLQRFVLDAGRFEANVAKLEPGFRFVVATPDAEIEVHGTRFEVMVGADRSDCAPLVRTRLMVGEGTVTVRHAAGEAHVGAGSSWPACEPRLEPPVRVTVGRTTPKTVPPQTRMLPEQTGVSTLAEQNDLFAAALAARQRGDSAEALRWLNRLLARFPRGQLVDSARAERERLLQSARLEIRSE
jgi:hypothetical protein